jgi:hypothetical protein
MSLTTLNRLSCGWYRAESIKNDSFARILKHAFFAAALLPVSCTEFPDNDSFSFTFSDFVVPTPEGSVVAYRPGRNQVIGIEIAGCGSYFGSTKRLKGCLK